MPLSFAIPSPYSIILSNVYLRMSWSKWWDTKNTVARYRKKVRLAGTVCYWEPARKISKIQETIPLEKNTETGARPKWPGILELRFIEKDTIHTLGGLALDLLWIYVLSNLTLLLKFIRHTPTFMGEPFSEQSLYAVSNCTRIQLRVSYALGCIGSCICFSWYFGLPWAFRSYFCLY